MNRVFKIDLSSSTFEFHTDILTNVEPLYATATALTLLVNYHLV